MSEFAVTSIEELSREISDLADSANTALAFVEEADYTDDPHEQAQALFAASSALEQPWSTGNLTSECYRMAETIRDARRTKIEGD